MMGGLKSGQGQLFYEFHLSDAVPEDHLVRKIDAALERQVVLMRRERQRDRGDAEGTGKRREGEVAP